MIAEQSTRNVLSILKKNVLVQVRGGRAVAGDHLLRQGEALDDRKRPCRSSSLRACKYSNPYITHRFGSFKSQFKK